MSLTVAGKPNKYGAGTVAAFFHATLAICSECADGSWQTLSAFNCISCYFTLTVSIVERQSGSQGDRFLTGIISECLTIDLSGNVVHPTKAYLASCS